MDAVGDALNYPYIRVRDVNWLKSTLLLFPHVGRIRPAFYGPPDDPEIHAFTQIEGSRGLPLLRSFEADHATWDNHERLLLDLRTAIETDGERLKRRFGRLATEAERPALARQSLDLWGDREASRTFQLHSDKILPRLLDLLEASDLAWDPRHSHGSDYVEMHPVIGNAVMASLAFAVARTRGCQLVTEFPEIYNRTIQSTVDDAFSAVTADPPKRPMIPFFRKKGQRVAEVVMFQHCDVSRLDAKSLGTLSKEHEALTDFRNAVEAFATSIPDDMTDATEIDSYVQEQAQAVLAKWHESRKLLGTLGAIFGDEAQDILKNIAKDGLKDAATVGGGVLFVAPTGPALLAAGAGMVIGLAFRTLVGRERKSKSVKEPLRYLSVLRKHGVAISVSGSPAVSAA